MVSRARANEGGLRLVNKAGLCLELIRVVLRVNKGRGKGQGLCAEAGRALCCVAG